MRLTGRKSSAYMRLALSGLDPEYRCFGCRHTGSGMSLLAFYERSLMGFMTFHHVLVHCSIRLVSISICSTLCLGIDSSHSSPLNSRLLHLFPCIRMVIMFQSVLSTTILLCSYVVALFLTFLTISTKASKRFCLIYR